MMSNLPPQLSGESVQHELARMRQHWWWFLLLGIGLLVLGTIAIGSGVATVYVSTITVVMFGFLLLIGGTVQIVSSFWSGKWSGFMLHLLVGLLYAVVGFLIVDSPVESLLTLTLMLAAFLIVSGVFRIASALFLRFPGWGWVLLNGGISVILGMMINKGWPTTGLFVIGLFVGIEMLFNGFAWVMFAFDLRRVGA